MKPGFKFKFFAGLLSIIVTIGLYMKGYSDGPLKAPNELANTSNQPKQVINKSQTVKKSSPLISKKMGDKSSLQSSVDNLTPNGSHEVDSSLNEDGSSMADFESDDIGRDVANFEEVDTAPRFHHEQGVELAE